MMEIRLVLFQYLELISFEEFYTHKLKFSENQTFAIDPVFKGSFICHFSDDNPSIEAELPVVVL